MNAVYDFLFLSKGELPFLLNSLKTMIDDNGFLTRKRDISMRELGELEDFPEVFIMDAEVFNGNAESRVFILDKCIEMNRKIVLIGEPTELEKALLSGASNVVEKTFVRPINNKEVTEKLADLIHEIRNKKMQKKILVVDDSPVFLRLISEWLEDDYVVSVCPSATAAFHMIETNKPDLILLDYEMPVCNGAQFLEMLHSEAATSTIPVIFLTSRDDGTTVKEVISLKPQGYLLKSQTKDNILDSIEEFFIREQVK